MSRLDEIKVLLDHIDDEANLLCAANLKRQVLTTFKKQNERVAELEEELEKRTDELNEAIEQGVEYLYKNQRYKQALERIAEHEVYGIDIRTGECLSTDAGEIAKSALRGDGDE